PWDGNAPRRSAGLRPIYRSLRSAAEGVHVLHGDLTARVHSARPADQARARAPRDALTLGRRVFDRRVNAPAEARASAHVPRFGGHPYKGGGSHPSPAPAAGAESGATVIELKPSTSR